MKKQERPEDEMKEKNLIPKMVLPFLGEMSRSDRGVLLVKEMKNLEERENILM
ncbi:MAG: hypothetical protein LBH96_06415 [Candidatus Peribacteria bacterium]|nr:hypothetical protein [Candidatus Peribacteria bacterium]